MRLGLAGFIVAYCTTGRSTLLGRQGMTRAKIVSLEPASIGNESASLTNCEYAQAQLCNEALHLSRVLTRNFSLVDPEALIPKQPYS